MRNLLFILVLIVSNQLQAQRFNIDSLFLKRCYISLSAGIGLPVMEFGEAKLGPSTGYAQLGTQTRIDFGLEVSRSLGIKVLYLSGTNAFNDKQYTTDIKATSPNGGGLTFNNTSTQSWRFNGIMLGVFYPIRNVNTTYELKLMVGLINSVLPQQDFIYTEDSTKKKVIFRTDEVTTNNIGYMGGVDIRHRLTGNWILKANFDFMYTEQTYSSITMHLIYNGNSFGKTLPDYLQYFHVIGVGIGIAYQLDTD